MPGTLAEIERVVLAVEQARSVEAAADALRPDAVMLPSAVRWVRRRVAAVYRFLVNVVSLVGAASAAIGALRCAAIAPEGATLPHAPTSMAGEKRSRLKALAPGRDRRTALRRNRA